MKNKLFSIAAILSLSIILFNGCISGSALKKVSNDYFEFQYLETDGWITVPNERLKLESQLKELVGDSNVIVTLTNEGRPGIGAIIMMQDETDPSDEKDLNLFLMVGPILLGVEEEEIEEQKIFNNKNNHPWVAFKTSEENESVFIWLTFCGHLYIRSFLDSTKDRIANDEAKLMEIIDSFHCKVPTNFKEESQND